MISTGDAKHDAAHRAIRNEADAQRHEASRFHALRVRVSFTVEIDREAWNMNYGTGTDAAAIRADVQTYIENGARDQLSDLDLLAKEVQG